MTTIYTKIRCAATAVAIALAAQAQAQVQTLPTVGVDGRVLRYYDVRTGDSIYSVARDLGITADQIIANNPLAADGLIPGMRLYFPEETAGDTDSTPAPGAVQRPLTHVVEKGESVYGISAKYNIPVETIIRLNPQADSGLHAGQVLKLSDAPATVAAQSAAPVVASLKPKAGYEIYTIGQGETLFGIADAHGTTLDAIQVANPGLDITAYSEGDMIYVPLTGVKKETPSITLADFVEASSASDEAATAQEDTPAPADYSSLREMSVAVVLPFMADDPRPSRAAKLNQEFLRGFMMGVRDMSNRAGAKVYVRAFDTKGSNDTLRMLLDRPEVSGADIIVVPDADGQMAFIEDSDTRSVLLNYFSIKDETYRDHSNVVQANIPHDMMYERAIDGFMQTFQGDGQQFHPVFLERSGGATDKSEFTERLRKRLDDNGITYDVVSYENSLSEENLTEVNPDIRPVVYIPLSGTRSEFSHYAPALDGQRKGLAFPENIALWGYPEFVTFKGDNADLLHSLHTTIYSRYYTNDNDYTLRNLRNNYKEMYGQEMTDAFPIQGIQGYDAAEYIVEALRSMADGESLPKDFEGAQSTLQLQRASGDGMAGLVNNSLFLIHYRDGNGVEKTRL